MFQQELGSPAAELQRLLDRYIDGELSWYDLLAALASWQPADPGSTPLAEAGPRHVLKTNSAPG